MQIHAPLNTEPVPVLQAIEISSTLQIPSFHIIGLPGPEVNEARERVRAAIEASGLEFPRRRLVLNLSPASIRKRGTGLDLAMALAVLAASGDTRLPEERIAAWGELGLDGNLKAAGQLTRSLLAAWQAGVSRFFLAPEDLAPAIEALKLIREGLALAGDPPALIPADSLARAWALLESGELPTRASSEVPAIPAGPQELDAQSALLMTLPTLLERAVLAAAAGAHHLLLLGPRGVGKSHALEWLTALQPSAAPAVRLQHALLRELSRDTQPLDAQHRVPVRRIGSQARPAALIGGMSGGTLRPGEFSLAHGGVLIADELPEWSRDAREALREPLERGMLSLTRAEGSAQLPAAFTLAANGNLCPCGGIPPGVPIPPDAPLPCRCRYSARKHYLSRISGPLLDRMDLVVLVHPPRATPPRLSAVAAPPAQRLRELKQRALEARERARRLWGSPAGQMSAAALEQLLAANPRLREALERQILPGQSRRARHKILRLALTLATCDGLNEPSEAHFAEAACHRPERIGLWAEAPKP